MKEFIRKLGERRDLTRAEAEEVMRTIMEGRATEAQIAAFLIAMRLKGEQTDEILGFVSVMREKSVKVSIDDPDAIDMCGTGGDGSGTFNISTVASLVVAGAGVTVAKHGNRSVSSSCGSADLLKALGVNIDMPPDRAGSCINAVGVGFLFAPIFHPAMKYAAKPRAELGIKTCFNLLGPLTNPAGVTRQLAGAYNRTAARMMGDVFRELGAKKAFVVNSHDGLDEISLHAPTFVFEVNGGGDALKEYDISASSFNLPLTSPSEVSGGSAERNAGLAMGVLKGEPLPHRRYVLANAAFGIIAAGKAQTVEDGVRMAAESIDSGRALTRLKDLIAFTNR